MRLLNEVTLDTEPSESMRSMSSAPAASEAAARQDAALAAMRLLDSHIRSIAFHESSPHAHNPAPLPPRFLPITSPSAVRNLVPFLA